jgi:hypothetical protein
MDNSTYAAHKIAHLLRQIAAQSVHLTDEQRTVIDADTCVSLATTLEASAPFDPCTDIEKQEVWEVTVDSCGDFSRRDVAEIVTEGWCEADWRMELEQQRETYAEDGIEGY